MTADTQTRKHRFFSHFGMILKNEFHGYNGAALAKDLMAGMTVGAVSLPLALAFGAASVDAGNVLVGIMAGLITAIVAGIVTGLLGGGSFQISGPTGAMTAILTGIVTGKFGLTGMFLACFFAGVIMLAAGLLKLGKLVQFIPRPVVTGFTSGIAVIIALGQLGNFFGVPLTGDTALKKTINFFRYSLGDIRWVAVACSVAVILVMVLYPKKLAKYVPGSLVAVILITVVSAVARLDIATIGKIPASLINSVHLSFSGLTGEMVRGVGGYSVTIALLGMVESLLCGTCAANMKKEKFDSNVELIAQGIGNMVVPFLGGVPSTAAIARTSVAITSGGRTRLTSVFQSLFLIACMFALSGAIGYVPYAALAGVLMMTAYRMNEWKVIRSYFKNKLWDAVAMFLITMVATVLLDLTYAIAIGVGFSMLMLVVKLTKIKIESSVLHFSDGKKMKDTVAVYMTGALFFANAKELSKQVERLPATYTHIIFSFRGIIYTDVTAVDSIREMAIDLRAKGKRLTFTGVSPAVRNVMDRTGLTAYVGEGEFYPTIDSMFAESVQVIPEDTEGAVPCPAVTEPGNA